MKTNMGCCSNCGNDIWIGDGEGVVAYHYAVPGKCCSWECVSQYERKHPISSLYRKWKLKVSNSKTKEVPMLTSLSRIVDIVGPIAVVAGLFLGHAEFVTYAAVALSITAVLRLLGRA